MSPSAFLVFPHQLFEELLAQPQDTVFILLEESLYFTQYNFHKQKIIFHRASMQCFADKLSQKGFRVHYLEAASGEPFERLSPLLHELSPVAVHYVATTDDWLERKLKKEFAPFWNLVPQRSPMFLSNRGLFEKHFSGRKQSSMASFYMDQRKQLHLLMDQDKPRGGQWSLDKENRRKLPPSLSPPSPWQPATNRWVQEATQYVERYFPHHYGTSAAFAYAVTHEEALTCLDDFLTQRFERFGPYEDAISSRHVHVYHSVLSPYLNTGLLLPEQVIDKTLRYAEEHAVPLNSAEGFLRQVIGWREYMLGLYIYHGRKERTSNFWHHQRKLPACFWKGTTGIPPVDDVINKTLTHAYSHHIERLMVMGNFMLLCEIDPDECYRWFMELYIDAYDWVMVPNVYTMSQYASGGTATTKPYLSGSNYILKMSDYKKGPWCETWDALYWRFIHLHRDFFRKNPRLSVMTAHLDKMGSEQLNRHCRMAEDFLLRLETL